MRHTMSDGGWKNWTIGALFTLIVPLAALSFASVAARVDRVESVSMAADAELLKVQVENRERLSRLEAQFTAIQQSLTDIKAGQDRLLARR